MEPRNTPNTRKAPRFNADGSWHSIVMAGGPSPPGSYGDFLVKRIMRDGVSFSGLNVCQVRLCVHHPGRPLWSDLSVCKLVSGGTGGSVPCCPIRGAGGVWRAGPILTAAYLSHSPVRCTAHPDGCQASGADHRLPVSQSAFNVHVHSYIRCHRRSGGCGEACAGWQLTGLDVAPQRH